MNSRLTIVGFVLIMFQMQLTSQVNEFTRTPDAKVFKQVSRGGWIKFNDNLNVSPESVFVTYKHAFSLGESFEMKPVKSTNDEFGYTHIKYRQYLDDILIRGGEYIIHARNGRAVTGSGKIITPDKVYNEIKISEKSALQSAMGTIQAKKYFWEDPAKEARLRNNKKAKEDSYYPKAEKIFIWEPEGNQLILTYSFLIYTVDEGKSGYYFVDTRNGQILLFRTVEYTCDHTTFSSNWYGTKDLWTNEVGIVEDRYDLENDCAGAVYGVYDTDGFIYNTPDNIWSTPWLSSCAQSLYSLYAPYYWFNLVFLRLGHDNANGDLDITQGFVFPGGSNNNASYTYNPNGDDWVRVGVGDDPGNLDDYNPIDILAHEFGHGITKAEADLDYQLEQGALNESFSDIFGEWIEYKELGTNNWLIGNDRIVNGCPNPLRYMVDPAAQNIGIPPCTNNFNHPNTYQGANWISVINCTPMGPPGGNDWCGVHINSGVQNQMFYLLSEGGSGWNNGQTCHAAVNDGYFWTVNPVGIDVATKIAYKVLCDYLVSDSQYADARNAWVEAAENIYGLCSFQAIQTGLAWHAVGIHPPEQETLTMCNVVYGAVPEEVLTPNIIATQEGCYVVIANTGLQVKFISGAKVHLHPGFHATLGSLFNAITNDCYYASY